MAITLDTSETYEKEGTTLSDVTVTPQGDMLVLTATFNTLGGANLAVQKLQDMENKDLLDVENTVTVNKNATGEIDIKETTDSTAKGAGVGALVGGVLGAIFPASMLATTGLGAMVGGMAGSLRGSMVDEAQIQAMADQLEPGQSMMVAVIEPQWQDEVQAALEGMASKIGWAVMDQAAVQRAREQWRRAR
jgi:uncharacterized membrane protein